jgi:hypothetical protein
MGMQFTARNTMQLKANDNNVVWVILLSRKMIF